MNRIFDALPDVEAAELLALSLPPITNEDAELLLEHSKNLAEFMEKRVHSLMQKKDQSSMDKFAYIAALLTAYTRTMGCELTRLGLPLMKHSTLQALLLQEFDLGLNVGHKLYCEKSREFFKPDKTAEPIPEPTPGPPNADTPWRPVE